MNDAERDAWLREALRHAPDIDALPPSGVSESILLKARAAARVAAPAGRRSTARAEPASGFAAFWAWLARPPIAGAFASIMAATLVGLMWWDRPMDETGVRAPAPASDRRVDATTTARAAVSPAPAPALAEAAPAAPPEATRAEPAPAAAKAMPRQTPAGDAKVVEPVTAPAQPKTELLAKERTLSAAPQNEAPRPFPSTETQRPVRPEAPPVDAAKKDAGAESRDRLADSRADAEQRGGEAESRVAAESRGGAPQSRVAAPAGAQANADAVRRAEIGRAETAPPGALSGRVQAQAAAAEAAKRQRLVGDEREKAAAGFAAAAPAPLRGESTPSRPDAPARSAAPLAGVLAAIAAEPTRWSRRTAGGDSFALDAGWRAWLIELDAAAAGQWRALDGGAASASGADREGATTLRLIADGSVAAVIRVEGATVRLDLPSGAGRWQAILAADAAERMRTSARRQSR